VDTWTGAPAVVPRLAGLRAVRARRYVYVSSRSGTFLRQAGLPEEGSLVAAASDLASAAAWLRCRPVEDAVRDTWEWLRSFDCAAPLCPDHPRVGRELPVEKNLLGN
jgi:hypothetical protein